MTLIVGSFLLILFIGFYFYFRQRQKARSKEILVLKREQEIIRLEALIKGEEKERYRLARDLHDGINGDLSVIKYKRTSINPELLSEQEKVPHQEAIIMLDNAVEQVRRISHNLAPPSLQNFSLQEAIHQYCSQISSSQSVNIDFQFFGGTVDLKEEYEMAIFRTVQELVNNVVRHSEASEALVQINHRDNQLHITVEDNGTGFDIDDKYSGMGLSNIRSRVDFMNGDLQIDSDSKGTTFNITIDLKNKRNND
ncbi:MAG: sensor histidine kinase [Bacteroidota bacterium]